jgi:hypothetical protein
MSLLVTDYVALPATREEVSAVTKKKVTIVESTVLSNILRFEKSVAKKLDALEAKIDSVTPPPTGFPPPVDDLPLNEVTEVPSTVHKTFGSFNLENIVRHTLFKRLHTRWTARSKNEIVPDKLRHHVGEATKSISSGDKLNLFEDYVNTFLKKRKFASTSFRHKYSGVNFKKMGAFFSNSSRVLNKLIDSGIA